jgi:hypothetical protein
VRTGDGERKKKQIKESVKKKIIEKDISLA